MSLAGTATTPRNISAVSLLAQQSTTESGSSSSKPSVSSQSQPKPKQGPRGKTIRIQLLAR